MNTKERETFFLPEMDNSDKLDALGEIEIRWKTCTRAFYASVTVSKPTRKPFYVRKWPGTYRSRIGLFESFERTCNGIFKDADVLRTLFL